MRSIPPDVRQRNLEELAKAGFVAAKSLPLSRAALSSRRPAYDIAARLYALDALVCFVADPKTPTERVMRYFDNGHLLDHLTDDERALVDAAHRDEMHRQHVDTIGWRLENMWGLAWVLGYTVPPALTGQMPGDAIQEMVFRWLPGLDTTPEALLERGQIRSDADVAALEDFFYCAHNAVRSAQLGHPTVPPGFHPVGDGGCVHERRHALTWCMSPSTSWDDTDLST